MPRRVNNDLLRIRTKWKLKHQKKHIKQTKQRISLNELVLAHRPNIIVEVSPAVVTQVVIGLIWEIERSWSKVRVSCWENVVRRQGTVWRLLYHYHLLKWGRCYVWCYVQSIRTKGDNHSTVDDSSSTNDQIGEPLVSLVAWASLNQACGNTSLRLAWYRGMHQ